MIALVALAAAALASSPTLGVAAGMCRADEPGPAIVVEVRGLKDRQGRLRLELYPENDDDFLADDNLLVAAGKTFARIDVTTPSAGPVELCIRAPRPGRYALMLLHDRDGDHRFGLSVDGVGFPGNPRLGWSKPHAAAAALDAGAGLTRIAITLNYLHGLGMRPEAGR